MKDANAPNMQNTITIYSNAVPIPSRNVRKAVKIDKTRLIGNKIIFNIHRIHHLFFLFGLCAAYNHYFNR